MPKLPTTAIIGAGSSGITAAKALHERGLAFDCFESSDRIGGKWVFGNTNGMSAAYRDLHINTSRERMAYSDLPMPKSYPDFAHHAQIATYFDAYVDRFGLRDRILTDIRRENDRMRRRYVASKRHTIQVDFDRYRHDLSRERRRGHVRARRAGYPLPMPARVAADDRTASIA